MCPRNEDCTLSSTTPPSRLHFLQLRLRYSETLANERGPWCGAFSCVAHAPGSCITVGHRMILFGDSQDLLDCHIARKNFYSSAPCINRVLRQESFSRIATTKFSIPKDIPIYILFQIINFPNDLTEMFQEQIRPLLKTPIFVLDDINNGTSAWVLISIAPFILLLLWRFWYFTIIPLIYPGNPIELPYWIPCE